MEGSRICRRQTNRANQACHHSSAPLRSAGMIARHPCRVALAPALSAVAIWAGDACAQTATDASAGSLSQFIAERVDRVAEHLGGLVHAVPRLAEYSRGVGLSFERAAGATSLGHVVMATLLCLLVGVLVEWALRRAARELRAGRRPVMRTTDRLAAVAIDAGVELGGVVAFAIGALAALLAVGRPGPINEVGSSYLVALVGLRLALAALVIVLRPHEGPKRALAALDLELPVARFWYRALATFAGWFAFGWAAIVTLRVFGMPQDGRHLIAYALGIGLVVIAFAIIWLPARSSGAKIDSGNAGKWLASLAAIVLWAVWAANAMPAFWFLTVVIGLPLAIGVARRASRHLLRPAAAGGQEADVPSVASVFVEQGLRAVLVAGAIWLLLWGWNLDVGALAAQESVYARLLRGALHALVIVLAADLAWGLIKAMADNALARAQARPEIDDDEARRRARVRTLLPIGRNLAFIVLIAMSGLMVLSSLGVEIGPLIASAGVVGVAVGFGAQTVVRDIISGMFYMIDDAFRVGEYIQSGNYKGTVESFSLRSIKLRHQRGPLFTVPFGSLGAVQNMSRDWVIVKEIIGITYDSDVDKAKKLIKQIGLDLAKDPDLGPSILQPLKMQGVEQFDNYGMRVRTKMMTKPGEQFVIRRRANAMIKKAFDANGIRFAIPTVQVAHDAEDSSGAAAQLVAQPSEKSR
ncbi:MAG: mechanosensitive ion channel family protein [Rhodospirillales bacterium]|nr:mechanosensitive ion channel family protein [Rhodospirillales bacterium]